MDDWLTDAIRKSYAEREDLTPFEQVFAQRFFVDDEDERVRDARDTLRAISKSNATLKEDAQAVLGVLDDTEDDELADLLDELDALVRITRAHGGVMLSEVGGSDFWTGILLSEIRHRVERAQGRSQGDTREYRRVFGEGGESKAREEAGYRETFSNEQ